MLASLPNKVLIGITDFLGDQKDRVHLAASCRHFRKILLPYAFNSISLNSTCEWTLSCLVHTLLQQPRCGAAVRSLSLTVGRCRHSRKVRFDRELLTRALQRIAHTEEELVKWRDNLEGKSTEASDLYSEGAWLDYLEEKSTDEWGLYTKDAWRAVLLILVPNLETLNIEWHPSEKYTQKVFSRALNHEKPFDTRPAFTRLRSISIQEWEYDDTLIKACDIVNSFRFPSLRQFSCYGVADFADDDEVSRITKLGAFSKVTDIAFYNSNSTNGFSSFVIACENLQSFVYEHIFLAEWGESCNPPAIFKTLLHHKDTLVKLHVYNAEVEDEPSENAFFGSLSNFAVLKDLRLRATNLLDWDREGKVSKNHLFSVLPASLVSLTIENFDECPNVKNMVEQLGDILRNGMGNFSLLESLEIGGFFLDPENDSPNDVIRPELKPVMALLSDACGSSGVEFVMRDISY
ncbi:uncharacterized protein APUU_61238S [Aspergillus puulaauensis]|uniref:Leucine-rich repeat domain-containing protein n=1 Tax=Aspergillus puulaauensis TaxID=1220207 RepID=A0A7R7XUZ3_9EURO|nr:uncharacterized protein APUU_61238S [Aspergillus puulaauensis]BCS28190.1 hypothetical protein APUU_61238S [Aspergillus puulaauensis]